MLQSMRNLAQSWVFKGLMLILIVSFGIWGVGDVFRGNPLEHPVAKVGDKTITVQDLSREFDRSVAQVRQSLGPDFTPQQAKQMGLLDMTLNNMIARIQVAQEVSKLGINISPKMILAAFASVPEFQRNGKFDKELMRQYFGTHDINERQFVEQQREDMQRHQLIDVFVDKAPVPQVIADELYKARGQKRILDVITLRNDSIGGLSTPDDKTLHDFYDANPKLFTAPEYRSVTVARLATNDIAKDITVTDEQVQKEYESHGAQLEHPEKRDVTQVLTNKEEDAKKIAEAAKASGNLTAASKEMGFQTISLGENDKGSLLPEIAGPIFDAKQKDIVGPIKSNLGWHVLQVGKIIPAGKPSFAEMKNELRHTIQRDQAIDAATKTVNQLDDELAAGHGLEDIADALKLRLIKIPAVDINGKTPDGKDPAELPFKADVLKQAFSQNSGETSPIMDDKNGNYYVVRTDDVTSSTVKSFDSIKSEIIAAWKTKQQAQLAKAEADKMVDDLHAGKPALSFSGRKGVEVRVSKPISELGDSDPLIPAPLVLDVMKMKKGDATAVPEAERQLILRLADIVDADEKTAQDKKGRLTAELNENLPKEMTAEYLKHLRTAFPVDIHHDTLDTIATQQSN